MRKMSQINIENAVPANEIESVPNLIAMLRENKADSPYRKFMSPMVGD